MDPLGLMSGLTDAEKLPRWSQTPLSKCPEILEERESPFPVNIDINDKICLWYELSSFLFSRFLIEL